MENRLYKSNFVNYTITFTAMTDYLLCGSVLLDARVQVLKISQTIVGCGYGLSLPKPREKVREA